MEALDVLGGFVMSLLFGGPSPSNGNQDQNSNQHQATEDPVVDQNQSKVHSTPADQQMHEGDLEPHERRDALLRQLATEGISKELKAIDPSAPANTLRSSAGRTNDISQRLAQAGLSAEEIQAAKDRDFAYRDLNDAPNREGALQSQEQQDRRMDRMIELARVRSDDQRERNAERHAHHLRELEKLSQHRRAGANSDYWDKADELAQEALRQREERWRDLSAEQQGSEQYRASHFSLSFNWGRVVEWLKG